MGLSRFRIIALLVSIAAIAATAGCRDPRTLDQQSPHEMLGAGLGGLGDNDIVPRQAQKRAVAFLGQSNAVGLAVAANVNNYSNFATTEPLITAYNHNSTLSLLPSFIDEGPLALGPRTVQIASPSYPAGTCGVEISAMKDLLASGINGSWYSLKMGVDGSGLENNWVVGGTVADQAVTWIQTQLTATGATLVAVYWNQGEADAGESPDNVDYLANLGTLDGKLRVAFGSSYAFVLNRLSSNNQGITGATIRAAQESFASNHANTYISVVDDLTLRDAAHYVDNGYPTAGSRVAVIIANHLRGTTTVANPRWIAAGVPSVASSTLGCTAALPANYATGDIGVLVVAGIGQVSYAAPSGWTQVTNSPQHDSASGLNARLQVFTKSLTASSESNPTIADVSGDDAKVCEVFTVRGASGIDATGGNTATASTALTFPSLTTTVDNDLVVNISAHATDITTPQVSGWANTDLVTPTEQFDVATSTGAGAGLGIATGVDVVHGSVGGTTATLSTSATSAKLSIAFKP